jgi:hypothetical protein
MFAHNIGSMTHCGPLILCYDDGTCSFLTRQAAGSKPETDHKEVRMDAPALNYWQSKAQHIANNPNKKIIFWDVDGTLLDCDNNQIINEARLFFTLWHLHQAGHLLAISTGAYRSDCERHQKIEWLLQRILRETKVQIFFDDEVSFNTSHIDDDLVQHTFSGDAKHTDMQGKNATILLTLAKLGLYTRPQHKHHLNPHRQCLPGNSQHISEQRQGIHRKQIILIDDDPATQNQALQADYLSYLAATPRCVAKRRAHISNINYLHEAMQFTSIPQHSLRWLQNDAAPSPQPSSQPMHWLYYLQHFYVKQHPERHHVVQQRLMEKNLQQHQQMKWKNKAILGAVMLGGVVAVCIGGALMLSGTNVPIGIVLAGVGAKVVAAKLGIFFGIGSASGLMLTLLKKYRSWRKYQRRKKYITDFRRSENAIRVALTKNPSNLIPSTTGWHAETNNRTHWLWSSTAQTASTHHPGMRIK